MKLDEKKALLKPYTIGAKLYTVDPDDDDKDSTPDCLVTILDYVPGTQKSLLYCDADGQQWWEDLENSESTWHWADNQELVFWDADKMKPMTIEELPVGRLIRARFGEDTYPARVMGYDKHSLRHQVQFEITEADICQTYWMWCTNKSQNGHRPTIIDAADEDIKVPMELPDERKGDGPPPYIKDEYKKILKAWNPEKFKKSKKKPKRKKPLKKPLKLPDSGDDSSDEVIRKKKVEKKKKKIKMKTPVMDEESSDEVIPKPKKRGKPQPAPPTPKPKGVDEDDSLTESDGIEIEEEAPSVKSRKRKLSEGSVGRTTVNPLKKAKKSIEDRLSDVDSEIVERGMAIPETRHIEVKKKLPVARVRNQKRKREGPPPLEPAKRSAIESTHGPTAIPAKPVLKAKKLPEEPMIIKPPTKIKEVEPQRAGRKVKVAKSVSKCQNSRRKASSFATKPAGVAIVQPVLVKNPTNKSTSIKKANVLRSFPKSRKMPDNSWKKALNSDVQPKVGPAPALKTTSHQTITSALKAKSTSKPKVVTQSLQKPKRPVASPVQAPVQKPKPKPVQKPKPKPPAPAKKAMPPPPSKATLVPPKPRKSPFPSDHGDIPALKDFKRTLKRFPPGYKLCEMSIDGWKCISDNGRVVFISHGDGKEKSKTWAILKSNSGHFFLWNSRTGETKWRPTGGEDIDWFGFLDAEILKTIARFEPVNTTLMSKELLFLLVKHEVKKMFSPDMTGNMIMEKVCFNEIEMVRDRILQHRDQQDYGIMWCEEETKYYLVNKHTFSRKWTPDGWEIIRWEDFFLEELCSLVLQVEGLNPDLQAEIVKELCEELVTNFNTWTKADGIAEAFKKLNRKTIRERIKVLHSDKQKILERTLSKITDLTHQQASGDFFDDLPDMDDVDLEPEPIVPPPDPTPTSAQEPEESNALLKALSENRKDLYDNNDALEAMAKIFDEKPKKSKPDEVMEKQLSQESSADVQMRIAPIVQNATTELESGVALTEVLDYVKNLCKASDYPLVEEKLKEVSSKVEVIVEKVIEPAKHPYEELYKQFFDPVRINQVNEKDKNSWKIRENFAEKLLDPEVDIDKLYLKNEQIHQWFDHSFYTEFNKTLRYEATTQLHTTVQNTYWKVYLKVLKSTTWKDIFGNIIPVIDKYRSTDEAWDVIGYLKSVADNVKHGVGASHREQKAGLLQRLPFGELIKWVINDKADRSNKNFERLCMLASIKSRKGTPNDNDAIQFLLKRLNHTQKGQESEMSKTLTCMSNFVETLLKDPDLKLRQGFWQKPKPFIAGLVSPPKVLFEKKEVHRAAAKLMRRILFNKEGNLYRLQLLQKLWGGEDRKISIESRHLRFKIISLISGALTFRDLWTDNMEKFITTVKLILYFIILTDLLRYHIL